MNRFRPGEPTPLCAFPKPVRNKRRVSGGKDVPKVVAKHDDILWACIEILQDEYNSFAFYHIPNAVYALTSSSGDLSYALANGMGSEAAMEVKQEIVDSIKGVSDLVIWSPPVRGKFKLSIMGEVKCGADHIRKCQRDWAKGSVFEWRSVAEFHQTMQKFEEIYQSLAQENDNG